jgi:hypothetical protein
MNIPTSDKNREFVKSFDWYGWLMSLIGIALMYYWSTRLDISWFEKISMFTTIAYIFMVYVLRVSYGRVRWTYYNTIIYNMYEVMTITDRETHFICAENEEDLEKYMTLHYIDKEFKIIDTHVVESFIKEKHYL